MAKIQKAFLKGFFILFLLLVGCASTPWTKGDISREIAWQVIHVVDTGQTLDIADNGHEYHEINPLLGRHPSRQKVYLYMTGSALLHPVVTHILPSSCRSWWQWITIGITGTNIIHNYSIGLEIRF